MDARSARTVAMDYLVAVTIATEVPPRPTGNFTEPMIDLAIRAVAEVIRNRAADPHFPDTEAAVVLQARQFSAVCREDYWRRAICGDWFPAHVERCLRIWHEIPIRSVVPGACWYYSPISMVPPFRVPDWAKALVEVPLEGMHADYFRFYRSPR